jgi:hypothetical protein
MYLTTLDGQRTAFMVFDLPDASGIPPFAEPFLTELNASVSLTAHPYVLNVAFAVTIEIMTGASGWTWAQTAALLAGVVAIVGALVSVALTYGLNQRAARRERETKLFAEALATIEDYAELPYRIRRRHRTPDARHELTEQISQIQSQIAFHQAWLSLEAPGVARFYSDLVRAAKTQAGSQMAQAWLKPAITKDAQVNLGVAYPRDEINAARDQCVEAMRQALSRTRPRRASGGPETLDERQRV